MNRPTRPKWRDGIKASTLAPTTRLVALLMADYWPKDDDTDLWCSIDTIISQSGLSRATAFRAVSSLQRFGWLEQTESARHNRAPRYAPRVPRPTPDQSHSETDQSRSDSVSSHGDTRHETYPAQDSEVGSEDPWATSPRVADTSATASRSIPPKTPDQRRMARMNADYSRLRETCMEIGDLNPVDVYWTLYHEHNAKHPDAFLRGMVETGQWEGFVGRHGISEYERDGTPA